MPQQAMSKPRESGAPAADAADVTRLLAGWRDGDAEAFEQLLPQVYGELRRLASQYLRRERRGHTLETHDLIHEAFLRLTGTRQIDWRDRGHFFAVAARLMRRILVEHARRRAAYKHGSGVEKVALDEPPDLTPERSGDIVALDEALRELAEAEPELGRIVELRFFGGLTHDELAELTGLSKTTVRRRWRLAKAWLYHRLAGEESHGA